MARHLSTGLGILVLIALVVGSIFLYKSRIKIIDPKGIRGGERDLFLQKYDFDALRKEFEGRDRSRPVRTLNPNVGVGFMPTQIDANNIEILGEIKEINDRRKLLKINDLDFTTREISFVSDGQKISGMINYHPERSSLSPVIIMVRGYAEKIGYYPGSGSWRMADELAKQGYATISLDFLGYANSDMESTDMLEARFHKVVEVLDLLESVKKLPWVDKNRIGFWAHSNGGQIVMSVLEITGQRYPTVMWAPMTQPFPESVLSTIDEGSPVKEAIEDFQKHYDARRYAFDNYYQWINSPIIIMQGTEDEWVEVSWQEDVVRSLKALGKDAELVTYMGADHNLKNVKNSSWEMAVEKTIDFFGKNIQSQ